MRRDGLLQQTQSYARGTPSQKQATVNVGLEVAFITLAKQAGLPKVSRSLMTYEVLTFSAAVNAALH